MCTFSQCAHISFFDKMLVVTFFEITVELLKFNFVTINVVKLWRLKPTLPSLWLKLKNTDRDGAGFTNQKTRIVYKWQYKSNNYAYIDSPTKGLSKTWPETYNFHKQLTFKPFCWLNTLTGNGITQCWRQPADTTWLRLVYANLKKKIQSRLGVVI